ncbi:MAG: 16S rRNA (guanine(966)-N(2))-methyltransferase RsmD [Desulfomonile sp.]|nr:16S rRNA (guanine(966)-N(2))-methyltransferase RsmD [Desulfomonile sp.]
MRIIAGRFKGVRLPVPRGREIRPTTGRVREALFSTLGPAIANGRVLELYAGTGAFGLEALSRGARSALFVDKDHRATARIARLAESLGIGDAVKVLTADAVFALKKLAAEGAAFDVIFLDPPYGTDQVGRLASEPALCRVVRPSGLLIVEREAASEPIDFPECFELRFSRAYGGTILEIFDRRPEDVIDAQ